MVVYSDIITKLSKNCSSCTSSLIFKTYPYFQLQYVLKGNIVLLLRTRVHATVAQVTQRHAVLLLLYVCVSPVSSGAPVLKKAQQQDAHIRNLLKYTSQLSLLPLILVSFINLVIKSLW